MHAYTGHWSSSDGEMRASLRQTAGLEGEKLPSNLVKMVKLLSEALIISEQKLSYSLKDLTTE